MALPRPIRPCPPKEVIEANRRKEQRKELKENVMWLLEAMISGGVDLSPEEMVDAAFLMVERVNSKIHGEEK